MKRSLSRALKFLIVALAPMLGAWSSPPEDRCGVVPCYLLSLSPQCALFCPQPTVTVEMYSYNLGFSSSRELWERTRSPHYICVPYKLRGRWNTIITLHCGDNVNKKIRRYYSMIWGCDGRADGSALTTGIYIDNCQNQ